VLRCGHAASHPAHCCGQWLKHAFHASPLMKRMNWSSKKTGMAQILFARSAELIKFRLQNSRNAVSKLPGLRYRSARRFACAAHHCGITISRVTTVPVSVVRVR
jgi:hypothetical protein